MSAAPWPRTTNCSSGLPCFQALAAPSVSNDAERGFGSRVIGGVDLLGTGPLAWNITVDSLSEAGGELVLTLHGREPLPQCTFALRGGKWSLTSKRDL